MKKIIGTLSLVILLVVTAAIPVFAADKGNARMPAIRDAADRVVELQRTDTDWEGAWYWYLGSTYNATNLTGVTALGLLEAYQDTKNEEYLSSAITAAGFIQAHLGAGATGTQHHVRTTAPDIVFLNNLSKITGDTSYADRASIEWENLKSYWPTASDLDSLFRTINRPSAWDIAFFLEAAYSCGDEAWADEAADILANTGDEFYYGDTWWYALNLSGAIRSLVACGYAEEYEDDIIYMLRELIALAEPDNIDGYVQDTAYAVLAFKSVGGAAQKYANDLSRWLARNQDSTGGWIEDKDEYPEIDGEAVRALSATIGKNATLERFIPRSGFNSSWAKGITGKGAVPFS